MAENNLTIVINGNVNGLNAAITNAETHVSKFERTTHKVVQNINKDFKEAASNAAVIGTAFQSVSTIINTYIINPLSKAVNGFVSLGDQISKTSQRIGIGVESLGGLKFAAEQCGANFENLTEGIKDFQNQLGAAQMGDAGAINKLGKSGLNVEDFIGLSNEDQLLKLADHIKAIGDKSEQTRVSMELFGKAGFKLLPFFQEGSEGIKKLIAEGKDIGAVPSESGVKSASCRWRPDFQEGQMAEVVKKTQRFVEF